jgi:hypothetical protein
MLQGPLGKDGGCGFSVEIRTVAALSPVQAPICRPVERAACVDGRPGGQLFANPHNERAR